MNFRVHVSGTTKDYVDATLQGLIENFVASRITDQDPTLWGKSAEAEASIRLGWVESVNTSRPLVAEIDQLRSQLHAAGVNRIVLAGMGGSSLAPEVIAQTANVELIILDSTHPDQIAASLSDRLASTALVVSSKSGSTVETDSQRRVFAEAFVAAGINPADRIIVVTDAESPLDSLARKAGYRVFNADPHVGGRFSALTAFGLVPAGLAGVDIGEILDEAAAASLELAIDHVENPGLVLGAALAAGLPVRNKLGFVSDGTHIVGLPDWVEQLVAESTGKQGKGLLPVVLNSVSHELSADLPDVQIVRLVDDAYEHHLLKHDRHVGDILVSGTLGAQFLAWEYATAVAGMLLGINPFDQPDVESAKVATRGLLDSRPSPTSPAFTEGTIEVRAHGDFLGTAATVREAISALLGTLGSDGYVAVQAYADRLALTQTAGVRDLIAGRAQRPVTFGWGPRFLHSTGQFHKGGPAVGVFIQILQTPTSDVAIPDMPFTFGQLIAAQAAGDSNVLASLGRPVLTLTLTDSGSDLKPLFEAFN
jgi:glucose-6-phosphate isomerase